MVDRISIHALHEESDASYPAGSRWTHVFQSTLSMRRATAAATALTLSGCLFQSTLSMRRATATPLHCFLDEFAFQSTLSMRRATQRVVGLGGQGQISIHALHEESDGGSLSSQLGHGISIHALHEESDKSFRLQCPTALHFNPRSP